MLRDALLYLRLDQLLPSIEKIVACVRQAGVIHLLHSRSIKDDESGLALKEFGARTIHDGLPRSSDLALLADRSTAAYRVTVFCKS